MSINNYENFLRKFKVDKYLIKITDCWMISLRPQQPTLGTLVVTLKRPCENMSDLTKEEACDLASVFKTTEKLFKETFKPEKVNYLVLMMIDNQVHFHVLPRYSGEITFKNLTFRDTNWPKPHDLTTIGMDEETIIDLVKYFGERIN